MAPAITWYWNKTEANLNFWICRIVYCSDWYPPHAFALQSISQNNLYAFNPVLEQPFFDICSNIRIRCSPSIQHITRRPQSTGFQSCHNRCLTTATMWLSRFMPPALIPLMSKKQVVLWKGDSRTGENVFWTAHSVRILIYHQLPLQDWLWLRRCCDRGWRWREPY